MFYVRRSGESFQNDSDFVTKFPLKRTSEQLQFFYLFYRKKTAVAHRKKQNKKTAVAQ